MKASLKLWAVALGVTASTLITAPEARAACGPEAPHGVVGTTFLLHSAPIRLLNAAFQEPSDRDDRGEPSIVGMWHVTLTAKTMNGSPIPDTVIDSALVVWHGDGTEIMNSGRPPQDGNFCMGVWKQTGDFTYKLNHFMWAGNDYAPGTPDGVVGDPVGLGHIGEDVKLGREGKHYSGTFTLHQYDTSGKLMTAFTGMLNATRITVDTTVGDLL